MYKKGGIISVTSQILVVDMLLSDMPTELITGILVLHAER
jgi:DNA excision repair protein ERCC-4